MSGPLAGVVVLEVGGIGPGPFAGMILADLGAEVIRIDRPGGAAPFPIPEDLDLFNRGKKMVALDLKSPAAQAALLDLVETADALIEGFRPGVAERLGFGPDDCHQRNTGLVYGRMTGWGQDGPWAHSAGHDINYISATGALHAIGEAGAAPQVPLNLVGDFGGGATYLVMGVLAALLEARATGRGQVVDAAIVDGVSHLLAGTHTLLNAGLWRDQRGSNPLDGAAPFYGVFETADARHLAVGPIEPQFWKALLEGLEVDPAELPPRTDPTRWSELRSKLATVFGRRSQAEWAGIFAGSDACVTPVVSLREAVDHPQLAARGTLRDVAGRIEPAPAPRFSSHPAAWPEAAVAAGAHTLEVLAKAGVDAAALVESGAAYQA